MFRFKVYNIALLTMVFLLTACVSHTEHLERQQLQASDNTVPLPAPDADSGYTPPAGTPTVPYPADNDDDYSYNYYVEY